MSPASQDHSWPTSCRRTGPSMRRPDLADRGLRLLSWQRHPEPALPCPRNGEKTGQVSACRPAGGTRCAGSLPSPKSSAPVPGRRLHIASRGILPAGFRLPTAALELALWVDQELGSDQGTLIVDESGFPKWGDKSVG